MANTMANTMADTMADIMANILGNCKKYLILGLTIIFIAVMLFVVIDNDTALNSNTFTYAFTIIIPLIIACGFLMNMGTSESGKSNSIMFVGIIGLISSIFIAFYFYSKMDSSYYPIINYILNILFFVGIMIALAIIYRIFANNINKMDGTPGFILNMIFFIPCAITDGISYLLQQYKLTPNVVLVLFVIEILIIIIYNYLPQLFKKLVVTNSTVLLNKPVFLDAGKITLTSGDQLNSVNKNSLFDSSYNKYANYSISMWIFINPQPNHNTSAEIFNYSNHPRITYSQSVLVDGNPVQSQYNIYFTSDTSMNITVTAQKWNQFVFNYNNNIVDIFVNGNLERSFKLSTLPTYSIIDTITVGQPNGIDGAICNVTYSSIPFTKYQIANTYNMDMYKTPPINNS